MRAAALLLLSALDRTDTHNAHFSIQWTFKHIPSILFYFMRMAFFFYELRWVGHQLDPSTTHIFLLFFLPPHFCSSVSVQNSIRKEKKNVECVYIRTVERGRTKEGENKKGCDGVWNAEAKSGLLLSLSKIESSILNVSLSSTPKMRFQMFAATQRQ